MKAGQQIRIPDKKIFFVAAGILLITAAIVISLMMWRKGEQDKERVKKGIAYLEELENQDVAAISDNVRAVKTELGLNRAEADEGAVWSMFENAAILGDSRAVGFSFYEFLPQEQVMAENGKKVTDIAEYMDQLKQLNPERIFLCFGLNDIKTGLWPEPADYAAEVDRQVQTLMQEFPDSTVYINSILPVAGVGFDADPDYARVGEYNEALQAMAAEKGYHYVDNTILAETHQDLYQEDGVHVGSEFYKYWAANMLTEVEE